METFLCLKSHFSFFPRPLGAFQGHRQGIVAASPYCTGISTCPIFGPQGGWNQEPSATLLGMINICSHAPISLKVVHFCWPQGGAVTLVGGLEAKETAAFLNLKYRTLAETWFHTWTFVLWNMSVCPLLCIVGYPTVPCPHKSHPMHQEHREVCIENQKIPDT